MTPDDNINHDSQEASIEKICLNLMDLRQELVGIKSSIRSHSLALESMSEIICKRLLKANLNLNLTPNPKPIDLTKVDVVAETNALWELELEYRQDLEKAKKKIAAKLIKKGGSFGEISEITELPLEQVKALAPA
ncbi:MAG: hypothetical protein LBR11_10180 [Deltaproteobacteria bacterium]|nr:hypothetical protein [Deltaproteobacteria bacterium]